MATTRPFNTALTPRLADLETGLAAVEAAVLDQEDSDTIEVVAGSTESSAQYNVKPFDLLESALDEGDAAPLTSGTALTIVSLVLPKRRVRLFGVVGLTPTTGPILSLSVQGISTTADYVSATDLEFSQHRESGALVTRPRYVVPDIFLDLSEDEDFTTVYLNVQASFTGGTGLAAYGRLQAQVLP